MQRIGFLWTRLLGLLAVGTVMMWVVSLVCVYQFIGKSFPGFIFESSLVASSLHSPEWEGHKAGLGYFDHILTADGKPLATSADLDRLVANVPTGTPITYEYLHGDEKRSMTIKTRIFSTRDAVEVLLPWVLAGSTYLWVGIVAFGLNPRLPAVQAHLVLCLAMALTETVMVANFLLHRFTLPLLQSLPFMGTGYLHLALVFPKVPGFVRRRPYLIAALVYGPAIAMVALAAWLYKPAGYLGDRAAHDFYIFYVQWLYTPWSAFGMLAFLAAVLYATLRAPTPLARHQAGIVLIGGSLTVILTILTYFLPVWRGTPGPIATTVEAIGQVILPISVAYAIWRHHLFDIQLIIRRGALYVSLTMVLAALYIVGAVTGNLLVGRFFAEWSGASVSGFLASLAVAVAFRPVHDGIRRQVDRIFLGERADAVRALTDFGQQPFPDVRTYAEELVTLIQRSLLPQWVCLVRDGRALATSGMPPASDSADHGLTLELVAGGEPQGMLQIGPRGSEISYSTEEQAMLRVLAAHAAVALHAGQLLEDQVQLRVSEGVARSLAAERESLLRQVVHDVRADLFNINLAVNFGKAVPEEVALKSIEQSMGRIESLLDEKIRMIKQGRTAISCPLRESLHDVAVAMAGRLREKGQTLALTLPDGEVAVPLSTVEFGQVLTNLLTNAHKFAPAGTVIRLDAGLDGQDLHLTVSDEGPGISSELLAALASGRRGDQAIAGHGLGLQIVETLLTAVGGRLAWRNGPQGAIVQAIIPVS
jgi:signal transduction histidine kinase